MSARGHHARRSDPTISFYVGDIGIYLENKNFWNPKSKLYYMKKKIITGKISLPIPSKFFCEKGYFGFFVTDKNHLEFLYKI